MQQKSVRTIFAAMLLAGFGVAPAAWGQNDFPNKPVKLVIPFAPGGSADIAGRVLAQKAGDALGQPMVVENKPGANSNLGGEMVAKSAPDGYTIYYNTSSSVFNMFLYANPGYDLLRDFAPVILTATVPQILVAHPALGVKNVAELVALLRARPGQLNYPSVGQGNIGHMTTELFLAQFKTKAVHVPYNGAGPAYNDLISGRLDFYFGTVSASMPYVKDRRVIPIAVTSLERIPNYPDIPTLAESGMPKFESGAWQGMVVPIKTPAAVIERLNAATNRALKNPELLRIFDTQGSVALGSTVQEYGAYLKSELDRWGRIIRELKIKIET